MGKPKPVRQDPLLERRVNHITVDDFSNSKKSATPSPKKAPLKITLSANSISDTHAAPAPEPTIKSNTEPNKNPAPRTAAPKPIIRRSPRFRNVDVSSKKRPLSSPRPTMSDMKRPAPKKVEEKVEKNSVPKTEPVEKPEKSAEKSPFLDSVSVNKRPLGTITTEKAKFAPIPEFVHETAPRHRTKSEKRRARAPFFVIILLAILLGIAVGALIYFVFPK